MTPMTAYNNQICFSAWAKLIETGTPSSTNCSEDEMSYFSHNLLNIGTIMLTIRFK